MEESFLADENNAVSFGSAFYKGAQIEGDCDDWSSFLQRQVILPYDNVYWSAMRARISFYDYDTRTTSTVDSDCRDSGIITRLVAALYDGSSAFEHCDAHSWRVFTCNSRRVLCLDCKENCVATEACPGRSFNINPCEDDCDNHVVHAANLKLNYAFVPQHPRLYRPLNATVVERDAMTVRVNLTKPGIAYCHAYVTSKNFELVSLPQLQEEPMNGYGYLLPSTSGGENMIIDVKIQGLGPDTLYDVYCYTMDYLSHVMPINESVSNMIQVQTLCCRGVTLPPIFPRIADVISSTEDAKFTFTLNAQPTAHLTVYLTLESVVCNSTYGISTSKYRDLTVASPRVHTFTEDSDSLEGKFTILGYQGCYILTARCVSRGSDRYNDTFGEVTIIDMAQHSPSAPSLQSVAFSDNGNKLLFTFDSSTSEPLFANSSVFGCHYISNFPGAAESFCRWTSPTVLSASLSSITSLTLPEVGDTVEILGGYIYPQCTGDYDCTTYSATASVTTTVSKPESAITPSVSLSSSKTIGSCDDMIVDPTGSVGHGGREWSRVLWRIVDETTPGNTSLTDPINEYLNNNNTDTPIITPTAFGSDARVTIPNELLEPGFTYSVSLELTNFLGMSGIAEVRVTVDIYANTPALSIAGPSPLVKYRYEEISLRAVAKISSCAGEVSTMGLTYTWKIYLGSLYLTEIVSTSKDPRVWKIDPFTLESNTEYTVQVTAVGYSADGIQPPISTNYVLLQIGQSGVYAELAGGGSQVISRSATTILDGSSSYDLDASSDSPSVLYYKYDCVLYSPNYGDNCENWPAGNWTMGDPYLTLYPYTLSDEQTYQITLTVMNDAEATDTATKLLEVVNIDIPSVSLGAVKTKYNVDEKMTISGFVDVVDGDVNAKWYSTSYLGVDVWGGLSY